MPFNMIRRWSLNFGALLVVFLLMPTSSYAVSIWYDYDALDRLVQVSYGTGIAVQYTYDAAGNRTQRIVHGPPANLESGELISELSGQAGANESFSVIVPEGATRLLVRLGAGIGNVSLAVRYGALATGAEFDCLQLGDATDLVCDIESPAAGTYFLTVSGITDFSGKSLVALYATEGGFACCPGCSGAVECDKASIQIPAVGPLASAVLALMLAAIGWYARRRRST